MSSEGGPQSKALHMINLRCVYKGCMGEAVWTFGVGVFNLCLCAEHGPLGYDLMRKFDKNFERAQKEGQG